MFRGLNYFVSAPDWQVVLVAGSVALAIMGLSVLIAMMRRRMVHQTAQTIAALNYMPLGFCMFDANKRLVLAMMLMRRCFACHRS
jgi:hypothetical protein